MSGTIFLVATPIGNLSDITIRALETLRSVDIVACEDTRHSRKLLDHFGITVKLVSYHEHNERERSRELIGLVREGRSIAVVSDAGTPAINDPGFAIVQMAIEEGIAVIPVPGPVAFVNALIVSGLPTDSFFFGGFLPAKKGERVKRLKKLADVPGTLVFYEAPHRLAASLNDCLEVLGNRKAAVVRELTKIHEEAVRGSLLELTDRFRGVVVKGEIVLIIDANNNEISTVASSLTLIERVTELEGSGMDRKAALKAAAKEFGLSKPEAYRMVQAEKDRK